MKGSLVVPPAYNGEYTGLRLGDTPSHFGHVDSAASTQHQWAPPAALGVLGLSSGSAKLVSAYYEVPTNGRYVPTNGRQKLGDPSRLGYNICTV